jgi:molybdenum cofactor guanylyltransferase
MNVSGVLLAGGASRRMGKDKATIIFRRRPLWQSQLDLLRNLELAAILLSARIDPPWRPPDVQFVVDEPPSRGPLSGLAASLAKMRSSHLLALAIDMPFMNEQCLRSLLDQIEAGRGVLPKIDNRAEPLAAIYPAEAYRDFAVALSGNDFSLQALTNQLVKAGKLRVVRVSKEDESFYRNLNEPANFDADPDGESQSLRYSA